MVDLEYIEIDGLLYPNLKTGMEHIKTDLGKYGNLAQHCVEIEQTAFEMAKRVRGQYLDRHPVPAEGMERIQAFELAQRVADEMVLHDIVYT